MSGAHKHHPHQHHHPHTPPRLHRSPMLPAPLLARLGQQGACVRVWGVPEQASAPSWPSAGPMASPPVILRCHHDAPRATPFASPGRLSSPPAPGQAFPDQSLTPSNGLGPVVSTSPVRIHGQRSAGSVRPRQRRRRRRRRRKDQAAPGLCPPLPRLHRRGAAARAAARARSPSPPSAPHPPHPGFRPPPLSPRMARPEACGGGGSTGGAIEGDGGWLRGWIAKSKKNPIKNNVQRQDPWETGAAEPGTRQ